MKEKKILKLILGINFFVIFLFFAFSVFAGKTTTNCCQIKKTFYFNGKEWLSGRCYGEIGGTDTACVTPGGDILCEQTTGDYGPSKGTMKRKDWGAGCILNTIYKITDLVFMILIVVAVIIGLAGGYNILTAGGDAEKVNKGRDLILYAILGVIICFFARAIPSIVALLI